MILITCCFENHGETNNCSLPVSFGSWDEFLYKCEASQNIQGYPEINVTVSLGVEPFRILNVDPDINVSS